MDKTAVMRMANCDKAQTHALVFNGEELRELDK